MSVLDVPRPIYGSLTSYISDVNRSFASEAYSSRAFTIPSPGSLALDQHGVWNTETVAMHVNINKTISKELHAMIATILSQWPPASSSTENGVFTPIVKQHTVELPHETTLLDALNTSNLTALRALLNTSNVNTPLQPTQRRPLTIACGLGDIDAVHVILDHNNVIIDALDGTDTPLLAAIRGRHPLVVSELLYRGANPAFQTSDGVSPILVACDVGSLSILQMLVHYGADLNRRDKSGQGVLHRAALHGNMDLLTYLVTKGLSHVPDADGQTPADLAREKGRGPVAAYLTRHQHSSRRLFYAVTTRIPLACALFFFFLSGMLASSWTAGISAHWLVLLAFIFPPTLATGVLVSVVLSDPGTVKTQAVPPDSLHSPAFCLTCHCIKPKRSKHCKVCGHCVDTFDHHCIWIGSCVGAANRRRFIALLAAIIVCQLQCIATLPALLLAPSFFGIPIQYRSPLWTLVHLLARRPAVPVMAVICLLSLYTTVGLIVFQGKNITQNLTTNERINMRRYKYLQGQSNAFHNPFDRGCVGNTREFFLSKSTRSEKVEIDLVSIQGNKGAQLI
ncbi:FG-GAP repeat [Carpediemonas membranifera]|uniref:Palmitoyltransferase n=1 Tax=Carpediemonas membranifera TaxID=201153 RepID=A0A8J6DZT5_9EUKA|nr:FG-GAP repeat [Carpediemonas membranifera]|eukprot:KAG9390866.1 FG-GAP repeat [Carpediemonas membranifera]